MDADTEAAETDPAESNAVEPATHPAESSAAQSREPDHVRLELPVSRSRAFDAYVRDFGSWWQHGRAFRSELHVEQAEGGSITERVPGRSETPWGEVHEIEVGARIRHSYRHAGEHPAVVTAEFHDAEHGGTVIDLWHEPWTGAEHERAELDEAWTTALRRLADDATSI